MPQQMVSREPMKATRKLLERKTIALGYVKQTWIGGVEKRDALHVFAVSEVIAG